MGFIWVNGPAYLHWQEPGRPQSSNLLTLASLYREMLNSIDSDSPVIPWLLGKSLHNVTWFNWTDDDQVVLRLIQKGWDVCWYLAMWFECFLWWHWSLWVHESRELDPFLSVLCYLCSRPEALNPFSSPSTTLLRFRWAHNTIMILYRPWQPNKDPGL